MLSPLWLLGLWPLGAIAALLIMHRRTLRSLWSEPVLAYPVLIVESDDWSVGPIGDAESLSRIASLLASCRDGAGNPAVMTIGVVAGHPDGAAILAADCKQYVRCTLAEPEFAPIVSALRDGCDAGVFSLQRHGLEHCWPASLLARARSDETVRDWLSCPLSRTEDLPSALQSRWVDCANLPSTPLPPGEVEAAVAEEAAVLNQVFGFVPRVAVPNTFIWDDTVERAWVASGVICIVTPGGRFEGRDASGKLLAATREMHNGERTRTGAIQVVRDVYFEPIRGHRAERAWQALERRSRLGRPTLLETHRESFIASAETAQMALGELARVLGGALDRHRDLRFMSTLRLAELMGDPGSAIHERSRVRRAHVFLRRLAYDKALARFRKYSGLNAVLRLTSRMAGAEKQSGGATGTR